MEDLTKDMELIEDSVYSNFDHILDEEVKEQLIKNEGKLCAQHAAWNFCGYIWFSDGKFHEEVWEYKSPIDVLEDEDLESLIDEANGRYGYG